MKTIVAGILAALLFAPSAYSQSLANADLVHATLAVNRDEGGMKSCGLNFMVGAMSTDNKATVFDFSVNIWNTADGLIKAGSKSMAFDKKKGWDTDKLATRTPGPTMFWIATRDDSVSLRPTRYFKGENVGYVLGGEDGAKTLRLLLAATQGDPLQASMQYDADRIHRVIGFRTKLSEDEQSAMKECLAALMKRMEADNPSAQ